MCSCCVPYCTANKRKCRGLSFFRFPHNEVERQRWIVNIRLEESAIFKLQTWTTVCSRHFQDSCFEPRTSDNPAHPRFLIKGSVPTLFEWNDFEDDLTYRKSPKKCYRVSDNPITSIEKTELSDSKENYSPKKELKNCEEVIGPLLPSKIELLNRIKDLEKMIKSKDEEIINLKIQRFGVERFSSDDCKIMYYTGFPDMKTFKIVFEYIAPSAQNMRSCYYNNDFDDEPVCKKFRTSMILIDEFFMFCVRIRLGLQLEDLSDRFLVSKSTISRKFITWSNFLYFVFGSMNIWLSRSEIDDFMPPIFKQKFPTTRVIIDCTELKTQVPSSLVRNSQMFSPYKGMCTVKCLIGIAPHGPVTFVSQLYTGNCSDVEIVKTCGILDLLQPGDSVMADKGFVVDKLLEEIGVTLNMPHFLSKSVQFSKDEVFENQDISSCRIHVERSIRRIKENLFFQNIPLSVCGTLNQTWTSAVLLTLFKRPIVQSFFEEIK